MSPLVDSVLDGGNRIGVTPITVIRQKLQRHQPHAPINSGDSHAIVPNPANRAGAMGSMARAIHRIAARRRTDAVHPPRAINIVHNSVAVVVNVVVGNFAGIVPHIGGEIFMVVVDAGINHRRHHVRAAGGIRPRIQRINIRARYAALLAGVVQSPQGFELRIIRRARGPHDIIRLGIRDAGLGQIRCDGSLKIRASRQGNRLDRHMTVALDHERTHCGVGRSALRLQRFMGEADQQGVGDMFQ